MAIIISIVLILLFYFIFATANITGRVKCGPEFLPPGEKGQPTDVWCTMNILTGVKNCNTQILGVNEVCTRQDKCDAVSIPFSVLPDGSSAKAVTCPDCRCVNKKQCSESVSSVFNVLQGNIHLPVNDELLILGQRTGRDLNIGSIILNDNFNEFCEINSSFLPLVSPGACQNPNDCINKNICVAGKMVVIKSDASVDESTVSCVDDIDPGFIKVCKGVFVQVPEYSCTPAGGGNNLSSKYHCCNAEAAAGCVNICGNKISRI
jgi:hypothetical protein